MKYLLPISLLTLSLPSYAQIDYAAAFAQGAIGAAVGIMLAVFFAVYKAGQLLLRMVIPASPVWLQKTGGIVSVFAIWALWGSIA